METAPRRLTSSAGNSCAASSEAEYTEAPASETTALVRCSCGWARIRSATSLSVSREAVPLPMATSSTLWVAHSRASVASEPVQSLRGWCG